MNSVRAEGAVNQPSKYGIARLEFEFELGGALSVNDVDEPRRVRTIGGVASVGSRRVYFF